MALGSQRHQRRPSGTVRRLNKKKGGGGGGRKASAGLAGFPSHHLHRQHTHEQQGALQAVRPHIIESHAPVLLMPTQKFMRAMLEIENAFAPTGPFTMRAGCTAQFISIFIENGVHSESITEALDVYESFHVLQTLPTRWSPINLFQCNCNSLFHACLMCSCAVGKYGVRP